MLASLRPLQRANMGQSAGISASKSLEQQGHDGGGQRKKLVETTRPESTHLIFCYIQCWQSFGACPWHTQFHKISFDIWGMDSGKGQAQQSHISFCQALHHRSRQGEFHWSSDDGDDRFIEKSSELCLAFEGGWMWIWLWLWQCVKRWIWGMWQRVCVDSMI